MKKVISLILCVSIILNIILGYKLYAKNSAGKNYKKSETQNESTFYNYCKEIYFIFEDLRYAIPKDKNINQSNNKNIKQSISKSAERFMYINHMMMELSDSDNHIKEISFLGDSYLISDYLESLMEAVNENITLDDEDISILNRIIDKGQDFGIYADSGKNYKKELDPEHPPLDQVKKLYQDIGSLCQKGNQKLETKLGDNK